MIMTPHAPRPAGWSRRDVFNWALNIVMGIIALIVAVPVLGTALAPLFAKPTEQWVDLGPAASAQQASLAAGSGGVGSVARIAYSYRQIDHWAVQEASDYAYVRYVGGDCAFFILSPICTHLGCHVDWIPTANQFHCPCHGSVYTIDGLNVSGPAPLPLGVFRWKIVHGHLYIELMSTFTHAYQRTTESPAQPCLKVG
jgi:menaquinol-cytochrome c reductase iron-sulfur subunit